MGGRREPRQDRQGARRALEEAVARDDRGDGTASDPALDAGRGAPLQVEDLLDRFLGHGPEQG